MCFSPSFSSPISHFLSLTLSPTQGSHLFPSTLSSAPITATQLMMQTHTEVNSPWYMQGTRVATTYILPSVRLGYHPGAPVRPLTEATMSVSVDASGATPMTSNRGRHGLDINSSAFRHSHVLLRELKHHWLCVEYQGLP